MIYRVLLIILISANVLFAATESLQSSGEATVGEAAPWLSGWTLADEVFNTKKVFKDESINRVALVFWASRCAPCKKGIRDLNKHSAEFNNHGIKVVLVNSAESGETIREFFGEKGPLFTVVLDPYSKNRETYMPSPLPKTVLIGRDGNVEAIFGKEDTDYVQRIIDGK